MLKGYVKATSIGIKGDSDGRDKTLLLLKEKHEYGAQKLAVVDSCCVLVNS